MRACMRVHCVNVYTVLVMLPVIIVHCMCVHTYVPTYTHCTESLPNICVYLYVRMCACLLLQKRKKLSQSRQMSQAGSRAGMRESQLSDLAQALEETAVTSTGTVFYINKQSTLGSGESPGVFLTQTAGECWLLYRASPLPPSPPPPPLSQPF